MFEEGHRDTLCDLRGASRIKNDWGQASLGVSSEHEGGWHDYVWWWPPGFFKGQVTGCVEDVEGHHVVTVLVEPSNALVQTADIVLNLTLVIPQVLGDGTR